MPRVLILLLLPFSLNLWINSWAFAADSSPEALLQASDRARGGMSDGLNWKIAIHTQENGTESQSDYQVQVKGVNVLAHCIFPPRQKDEVFLFNDRNLWVYRPGLRKPISISPRQRLSGQAANGDIATTNYARDYSATLLGKEVINGVEAYKLKLKAKSDKTTYDGVIYWISVKSQLGIQAEFLTLEERAFKRATFDYKNSITVQGKSTPFVSLMTITDAMFPKNQTTIQYEAPKAVSLSDNSFNVNNLAR